VGYGFRDTERTARVDIAVFAVGREGIANDILALAVIAERVVVATVFPARDRQTVQRTGDRDVFLLRTGTLAGCANPTLAPRGPLLRPATFISGTFQLDQRVAARGTHDDVA